MHLIQYDWGSYEKRLGHRHTQRKDHVKMAVQKPGSEALGEISPADTVILDSQPADGVLLWQPEHTYTASL